MSLLPQFLPSVPAYTLNRACASGGPGDHQRRRPDRARPRRRDPRRRRRDRSPTSPSCTPGASARSWWRRARRRSFGARVAAFGRHPPARPGAGDARDRRAVHRRDDGTVGREDGQGERDHAARRRTSWRCMSHQRAAAATADGRLTAEIAPWFGGAAMDQAGHAPTTASAPTPRSRRWPRSSRCSTGATARSPPATRRRSPTAPRRCC